MLRAVFLLSRKSKKSRRGDNRIHLVILGWLVLTFLISTGNVAVVVSGSAPVSLTEVRAVETIPSVAMGRSRISTVKPADANAFGGGSGRVNSEDSEAKGPQSVVEKACELVYEGKFDAAGEWIEQHQFEPDSALDRLVQIVREYQALTKERLSVREEVYRERLAELDKLKTGDSNDVDIPGEVDDVNIPKDVNDVNDANDAKELSRITSKLSVIAKAGEFADDAQKSELLGSEFVRQVFQEAIDKASEFEAKGEWLESYIVCYSWLQAIDKDNQAYSDYADELLEKANIVASFQDSPCETQVERYDGVAEELFVKAVKDLDSRYVSVINYTEMATAAVKRCRLLAEVMDKSFSQIEEGVNGKSKDKESKLSFTRPDSKKLSAWLAALAKLQKTELDPLFTDINRAKFVKIFETVLALNDETVQLPKPVLIAQFAEASLSSLDQYTVMVWPKQVQDFEKIMTSEFTGIGIEISKLKGLLTVASLLPDTPAYYSGLDAEDVIEQVDSVPTKDMTLSCAVKNITGPAGTDVRLTIRRPGEEQTREIMITRARIIVPTIRGWQRTRDGGWRYMIDEAEKIGYIRLTSFAEKTSSDLDRVLKKLEGEGVRGLILDLRFNSGGLLDSAINVTDKFIKGGWIVSTRPRYGFGTDAVARKNGTHPDYPLVILVNSNSASASEIVAGALADKMHKRAVLVGDRTHGKGSVQGIIPYLRGRAQLKYTMAYYILPSRQRVESREMMKKLGRKDWGVAPDVGIKLRSDELKKRLDIQKDNDVLVKADHQDVDQPLKKRSAEETIASDPQLAAGLMVVNAKLIERYEKSGKAEAKKGKLHLLNVEP